MMLKVFKHLTFQVLLAIVLAVFFGYFFPDWAVQTKPLGDLFIRLIKMIIPPVVFLTVVLGIGGMQDLKKIGRIGGKALIYFEVVTTFALLIGIVLVNWMQPGVGLDLSHVKNTDISEYINKSHNTKGILDLVFPESFFQAFASGEMLQIVFLALLFGLALSQIGEKGQPLVESLERIAKVFFKIIHYIMHFAPFGAFGAMAYIVGKHGLAALIPLGKLMLAVYGTMFLFIFVVLNGILRYYKISLWEVLKYIKDELLTVLGTSSSESVLPQLMDKLERLGCSRPVVGLVVPTGYSFNLDGTTIYLAMATVFLAQVQNVALGWGEQLTIIGILMLTSKGAAGVSGSGFTVLISTLAALQIIPVEGAGILLGVDKFMSEARAITNTIGNVVATLAIAKNEGELDEAKLNHELYEVGDFEEFKYE